MSTSSQYTPKTPENTLLIETQWRFLGVRLSAGWTRYAMHSPEPNILLFRRKKGSGSGK